MANLQNKTSDMPHQDDIVEGAIVLVCWTLCLWKLTSFTAFIDIDLKILIEWVQSDYKLSANFNTTDALHLFAHTIGHVIDQL